MKTTYHYDDSEDRLTIATEQDVEPIIEANKRMYNDSARHHTSEVMNHVARVPLVILEKWCNEHGISYHEMMANDDVLRRFLNDPANKFLRTRPGKI